MLGRLSLRARLLLGVIALTAIGLGGANVATYASLRGFLLDRTDETVEDSHLGIERGVHGNCDGRGADPVEFSYDASFNYRPGAYERPGPVVEIHRLRDCSPRLG